MTKWWLPRHSLARQWFVKGREVMQGRGGSTLPGGEVRAVDQEGFRAE